MQTPWGPVRVSDAHAHFFSRGFFEALAQQKTATGTETDAEGLVRQLGWDLPPADNTELAAHWINELDKHGVDQIALMASVPGDESAVADAVKAYPNRIHGYFMLNPLGPDAAGRARRAVGERGLKGICLFPAMQRFSVQDERLRPIYELAAERPGVLVFVHMGVLSVGVRKKLGLPCKFDISLSNPIDLHPVALDYPQVNFVIPHFGAGFFREVLMLGDLAPNVYVDTSSTNSWLKYQTPEIDLKTVFAKALDIIGPGRILFGSDSSFFPRGWVSAVAESQLAILSELGIGSEDASAILGGNLRRLLG